MKSLLALALLAAGVAVAGDAPAPHAKLEKLSLLDQYEFGLMNAELGMHLEEPVNGEELLVKLRALERTLAKRPVSEQEALDGMWASGYLQGVYRAFLVGIAAENYRLANTPATVPPLCQAGVLSYGTILSRSIAAIEKMPGDRKASTAHATLVNAFLQAKLYGPCQR
jgi:hypothetical protein